MATVLDDLIFRIIVRKEASATANVNQFLVQVKQVQKELDKTAAAQRRLAKAQSAGQRVMGAFRKSIGRTVAALGGFLIIRRITRLMTGFETAIAEMATVASGSAAKVAELRRQIVSLSKEVPQSATQLGAGAYQILSAQILDTADVMTVLTASSKAAVAGITDTLTAVDAITTVLNAFRFEASEANRVADVLFRTVELGKIRFRELSKELGTAVTSAALAGVTLEELSAAIATITLRGIPAAETTTSLNRLFIALTRQTKQQRDAFRTLGIEFNIQTVRTKGFVGLMEEINKLTGGQIDLLSELFPNIRAARSAFVLAGSGIEQYKIALDKMNDSSGSAERAFAKVANTSTNTARLLKNNFNAALLELSESILPATVAAMGFLIDVLDRLNFKTLQTPQFIASIKTLSDVLTDLEDNSAFDPARRREIAADLARDLSQLAGPGVFFGAQAFIQDATRAQIGNLRQLQKAVSDIRDDELVALARGARALTLEGLVQPEEVLQLLGRQLAVINAEIQQRPELLIKIRAGIDLDTERPDAPGGEDFLESLVEAARIRSALEEELARILTRTTLTSVEQQIQAIAQLRLRFKLAFGEITEEAQAAFDKVEEAALKALRVELATEVAESFRDELKKGLQDIELELFITTPDQEERANLALERQLELATRIRSELLARLELEGLSVEENERLREVLAEVTQLLDRIATGQARIAKEAERAADAIERANAKRFRDIQLVLSLIRQSVDGVIELANAFGLVDDEVAQILRNMEQVAIGAATLAAGLSTGNLAGIAAGATGLAGGVAGLANSLFGESEEGRRQRETLERNTRAIELLTETISIQAKAFGQFTGKELVEARSLARVLTVGDFQNLDVRRRELIERIAETLGITLDNTQRSFEALNAALNKLDITRLVEDFTFASSTLQKRFEIFDVDNPIEQLEALIKLMNSFGAGINFRGDFTKGRDRDTFETIIKALFEGAVAGTIPTGKLTLDEFLSLLVQMEGLLDDIEGAAGDTKQFAISRTITEVTGSRIAALLFGIQFETTRIADNSDIMVRLLSLIAGVPLAAPIVTGRTNSTSGPTGGTLVDPNASGRITVGEIEINVIVTGFASEENASAVGQLVGEAVVEQIDRGLGDRIRAASRQAGEIVLP